MKIWHTKEQSEPNKIMGSEEKRNIPKMETHHWRNNSPQREDIHTGSWREWNIYMGPTVIKKKEENKKSN